MDAKGNKQPLLNNTSSIGQSPPVAQSPPVEKFFRKKNFIMGVLFVVFFIIMGLGITIVKYFAGPSDNTPTPTTSSQASSPVAGATPYCIPNNGIFNPISAPTPTQGDTIAYSELVCSNGGIVQPGPNVNFTCTNNTIRPVNNPNQIPACNPVCPTPSNMVWVGSQPTVGQTISIAQLRCSNTNITPSPSTGTFTCAASGIINPPLCVQGYENYTDQVINWTSGRPDINNHSKYSLLPGYV
jgi:hypothetical protein